MKKRSVVDLRLGLGYFAVLLDDGSLGLAHSLRSDAFHCCEISEKAGELGGGAWDLARLALAPRGTDSSVGVATINAAVNPGAKAEQGDVLDFLDLHPNEKIGMIGYFRPIVPKLREAHELLIFERSPQGDEVYPDWAAEKMLPTVDVAIITGTAIINKTIDHLLELTANARQIAVVGPSTTLAADVFAKRGVTLLSGMVVDDVEKALNIVSQGGGTRRLSKVSRKVTVDLRKLD
ncbi:MAG: Rossmann-like domain-containing protein [Nitrososphaeria archaeon]